MSGFDRFPIGADLPVHVHLDGGHPCADALRATFERLAGWGGMAFEISQGPPSGRPGQVVVIAGGMPVDAAGAGELAEFVTRGGGLVTLSGATAPALTEITGWRPGLIAPPTEVVIRAAGRHLITDRLDSELRFREAIELGEVPTDALSLLTTRWRFDERVVAYTRDRGSGRVVHLGLGASAETCRDDAFAQLLWRCIRHAGGVPASPGPRIGLLGYGAIAREHATAISEVEGLTLAAVCDVSPERREAAAALFGVRTHASLDQLMADPDVDLVVVGTPPNAHLTSVLSALAAGKHVICEKPLALSLGEVDRMVTAAEDARRVLTVYQNRRWDPDFVALRRAVTSGMIGEAFYLESFIGGFSHPCQFWHSHQPVSGGAIFDWGSHYFDWIFQILPGPLARIAAQAHKRVWHDVTNSDQVRVDLTFADGRQAAFMHSDVAAALKPKWYVLGTEGAIVGDWRRESVRTRGWSGDLVEERLAPADSPAELTLFQPDGEGQSHRQLLALPSRRRHAFYRNLADHLIGGEPLAVLPEQSRRSVAVMEAAMASLASEGCPIRVDDG